MNCGKEELRKMNEDLCNIVLCLQSTTKNIKCRSLDASDLTAYQSQIDRSKGDLVYVRFEIFSNLNEKCFSVPIVYLYKTLL